MSGHTLLVHPDVDDWMRAQPDLRRRVDWLLFELTTRGDAGRPKGIVGPSALVTDAPALRWRRRGGRLPLLRLVVPGGRLGRRRRRPDHRGAGRASP